MARTWFITGASRGFGREWTIAALERGDTVAATARDTSTLDDLVQQFGDRCCRSSSTSTTGTPSSPRSRQAHEHFGRLDVVVNNAGYGQFGMIEEISEAEARAQFETNVFGALWVTQAALPYLREQGSGHILQVSSIGGISAFPNIGIYNASKWALEAFSQSLAAEVADFGIKVTLIEPGGYSTDWGGASAKHAQPNPAYDAYREKAAEQRGPGSPRPATRWPARAAVLQVVDAEKPPLRVFFGDGAAGHRHPGLRVAARRVARVGARLEARPGLSPPAGRRPHPGDGGRRRLRGRWRCAPRRPAHRPAPAAGRRAGRPAARRGWPRDR